MIVVGVDPGKMCGVAFLKGRRLMTAMTIRGDRLDQIVAAVQQAKKLGAAVIVIELQHGQRPKGGKVNYKSLATLFKRRHAWEVIAELYGLRCEGVWPSTWQTQLKSAARLDEDGNKRTTKERSIEVARFYYGETIKDAEQSDAALIARWYANGPHGQQALPV